jgi:hypothetical protein
MRALLKQEDKNDGTFWISIDDFTRYFEGGVYVALCHDDWVYDWAPSKLPLRSEAVVFQLQVKHKTDAVLTFHQTDRRLFTAKDKYDYAACRYVTNVRPSAPALADVPIRFRVYWEDTFEPIGGSDFICGREVELEFTLEVCSLLYAITRCLCVCLPVTEGHVCGHCGK